jgi:hypothetical protein
VILKHLPDKSPFKVAYSEDWPLEHQLTTGVWNEIKAMRGDLWAYLGHERLPFKPVLTPSAAREKEQRLSVSRAAHDDVIAQLRGQN